MWNVYFENFGERGKGVCVTSFVSKEEETEVYGAVFSRNPYGTHNLVLINISTNVAVVHGNLPVLEILEQNQRAYRKAIKFLSTRRRKFVFPSPEVSLYERLKNKFK